MHRTVIASDTCPLSYFTDKRDRVGAAGELSDNNGHVSHDLSGLSMCCALETKGGGIAGGRECDKLSVRGKGELQTHRSTPTSVSALIPCITLVARGKNEQKEATEFALRTYARWLEISIGRFESPAEKWHFRAANREVCWEIVISL